MSDGEYTSSSPSTPQTPVFAQRRTSCSSVSSSAKRPRSISISISQRQQTSQGKSYSNKRARRMSTSKNQTRTGTGNTRVRKGGDTTSTIATAIIPKKHRLSHAFTSTLSYLSTPLHPLVSTTTGLPHPEFPTSLLQYHLLTDEQLDALARHYHQFYPPIPETYRYPMLIKPWVGIDSTVDLSVKRRRFGRFIGLRGCESPVSSSYDEEKEEEEEEMDVGSYNDSDGYSHLDIRADGHDRTEEDGQRVLEQMEKEWNRALGRAREEDGNRALGMKWGFYY